MLWLFVALQTMTPFIHAHAGDVEAHSIESGQVGFLHAHPNVHLDAACETAAADGHEAEIDVATGVRARKLALPMPCLALAASAVRLEPLYARPASWPGAGRPDIPVAFAEPAHSLPPALAPPLA
ncbi:MAG: hypothetical protein IV085_03940 [Thiobacillus sp.]|nr:hypothetical protein [Thiobacillus sp.]